MIITFLITLAKLYFEISILQEILQISVELLVSSLANFHWRFSRLSSEIQA